MNDRFGSRPCERLRLSSFLIVVIVVIVAQAIMKRFIDGEARTQVTWLAEGLDDYITDENPVRVVAAFVDELDLSTLGFAGVEPAATGRPAYHPAVLLKIYIYGYLIRTVCRQFVILCRNLTQAKVKARMQQIESRPSMDVLRWRRWTSDSETTEQIAPLHLHRIQLGPIDGLKAQYLAVSQLPLKKIGEILPNERAYDLGNETVRN